MNVGDGREFRGSSGAAQRPVSEAREAPDCRVTAHVRRLDASNIQRHGLYWMRFPAVMR